MREEPLIAVVDDKCARDIKIVLETGGFNNVVEFESGSKFLQHYTMETNQSVDIVLLDIHMPADISGLEVLMAASHDKAFEKTLFVAISGYLGNEDCSWLEYLGFDAHIPKLYDISSLVPIIHKLYNDRDTVLACRNPESNLRAAIKELSQLRIRQSVLENEYIKRLISPEVFKLLNSDRQRLNPHDSFVAIGFVDIRNFTQLMNRIQISQMDELLKLFFDFVCNCILKYGGHLDKFIGDSVMWFHEGCDKNEMCNNCVQVAMDIINGNKDLNIRIEKELHYRINIKVGIGLACGHCAVGIFGAPNHRIQYSILGPAVNLASRICSEASPSEILVGGEFFGHCENHLQQYNIESKGFRSIKGFDHEVELGRILIPKTD